MIDRKGLQWVLDELLTLNEKPNLTKKDSTRMAGLIAMRKALESGDVTLRDLQQEQLGEVETRYGLPRSHFERDTERRAEARAWSDYLRKVIETRDETVGNGHPDYFNGTTGSFVPRAWFERVRAQMKWFDPLLDDSVCTVITTTHGRPVQFGFYDDTSNVASCVLENSDQSGNETDPANVSAVDLRAFSYRSPGMFRFSIEALQDLDEMGTVLDRFQEFSASRMGLGVGRDLMVGNGSNKPLGLLTSLMTLSGNCSAGVCTGSSESTGGAQNGSNSLGYSDLNLLFNSIDQANHVQPKCGWLCNASTRQAIAGILDKQGRPLHLIEYRPDGKAYLFGKPLYISPSMANIGAGNIPIVFGDLGAWVTRHTVDANTRIKLFFQTQNLIERGEAGLRLYEKWDGALLINGSSTTPPLKFLINHS